MNVMRQQSLSFRIVPIRFVIVYGMNIRCAVILLCISFKSNEIATGTAGIQESWSFHSFIAYLMKIT